MFKIEILRNPSSETKISSTDTHMNKSYSTRGTLVRYTSYLLEISWIIDLDGFRIF